MELLDGAVSNYTPKILRQIGYSHRNRHNKVLIWDNDMKKINDSVDKVKEEEKIVDSFEKMFIYLNEQEEYTSVDVEKIAELEINLSDEQIKVLQECYKNESYIKKDGIELYLENFYRDSLEKHLNEKYSLAVSKRYHEKFMELYSELEEDYMENEDIFNPDSIITGKIIKDINIEDIEKEVEIHDINVNTFSISTLGKAAIRQADAEYVYEIFQNADLNRKEFKEALENIKGLPMDDIENIVYEKYINDKTEDREIIFKDEDFIDELGLDVHEFNALKRQGIDTIGQLLSLYDIERCWTDLRNIKNIGDKGYDKVLKVLEQNKLIHNRKPTSEAERVILFEYVDIPLEELSDEMSVKAYKYLKISGFNNIGDILTLYDEEKGKIVFPKRKNVGNKTYQEILTLLEEKAFLQDGKPVKKGKEDVISPEYREVQRILDLDEDKQEGQNEDEQKETKEEIRIADSHQEQQQKKDEQEEQTKVDEQQGTLKDDSEQEEQKENDSKEQVGDMQEEIEEKQESNLNNEYEGLVSQILECDTEYTEIQKNYEVINLKRENIKTKIEELIHQIDETSNNNVTQTVALTLMASFKLLQEQKALLKEIDEKLKKMNEVEKANREKRNGLTQRLTEIIRGGE